MTEPPKPPFIRSSDGSIRQGRSVPPRRSPSLERVCGQDMTFVRVDNETRLQFGEFEIMIESPFRLTAPDGSEHHLDPGERTLLGPVLGLYADALISATVDADATLLLRLASGVVLDVPAEARFEAWQVSGPEGFLVVCAPGGEYLSVWGDE